jgi:hypothetical protein
MMESIELLILVAPKVLHTLAWFVGLLAIGGSIIVWAHTRA